MSKIIEQWEPMNGIPPVFCSHKTAMITNELLQVGDYFPWHMPKQHGGGHQWYRITQVDKFKDLQQRYDKAGANAAGQHGVKANKYYYELTVEQAEAPTAAALQNN